MEPTDLTGAVLDGRYKVIEPISEGAMGVVYRAERLKLGRIVAIKVLHDELPAELSSRKRFEIEAMAMAKLEHPHCAAVIDVGVHDDKPFVVMDFVSGDNLAAVIAAGPVPVPRAVEIVRQVLSGLAHAHEHGIIHRDIKPANIVLSQKAGLGDHVKILDFGLARFDNSSQNITTGIVVGTPSYMSPEQIRGVLIDHRSDIYACGVLLFELLTGTKPFVSEKDDPVEVCSMHLKQTPPTLAARQPGISFDALEDIVARALAKKPEDRFANAVEFASALDTVSARRSQPISTRTPPTGTPIATDTGWSVPVEAKSSFHAPDAPSAPVEPPAPQPAAPVEAVVAPPPPSAEPVVDPASRARPSTRQPPAPFNRKVTPVAGTPAARPPPTPAVGTPVIPPSAPMAWVSPSAVAPNTEPHVARAASEPASIEAAPIAPYPTAPSAPVAALPTSIAPSEPVARLSPAARIAVETPFKGSPVGQVEPLYAELEPTAEPAARLTGLPTDFDLSLAIPREALGAASAKGLSPGFDLSVAIPAAPDAPILERSGKVASGGVGIASGPVPEAAPEITTAPAGAVTAPTTLGLAVVKPAGDTVPASPPPMAGLDTLIPKPAKPTDETVLETPNTAKPTDETVLEVPVATAVEAPKDNRETVAFLGAPPAGPSPLAIADAPEEAEPPGPEPAPWQPTKKQLKIAGAVVGVLAVIAIVASIAKCGGKTAQPIVPAPPTMDSGSGPAQTATADQQLAKATELHTSGRADAALDQLLGARKLFPRDARLSYLAGKIYFEKQWWSAGLKQFRDTLAIDPTYRSDPDMIKIVLKAFIAPAEYRAELGSFLRNDIGPPARAYLEETANSHPRAATRQRAKRELDKMK